VVVNLHLNYKKFAVYELKCLNPENMLNQDLLHADVKLEGTNC